MSDPAFIRYALGLARRGYGATSPNPMVGAVLVRGGRILGRGWHQHAGGPHAEIEALRDAARRGHSPKGSTLFVTLEPCSTHGRTPPCTDAIITAGIKRVVVGATDPNPKHAGKGLRILKRAGIQVTSFEIGRARSPLRAGSARSRLRRAGDCAPCQLLADQCVRLNEAFNHWIVHRTPFVTVKAAMTLDGKIATASGESKWITGQKARSWGMKLRRGADAILVGVNTILADDPSLTVRTFGSSRGNIQLRYRASWHPTPLSRELASNSAIARAGIQHPMARRIVLDSRARTPLSAKVVCDRHAALTTVVVSRRAPRKRVAALAKRVNVMVAPARQSPMADGRWPIDVRWLLKKLGAQDVTSLLVEGGGEVNASLLLGGLAHRVAFFYAPKILGGRQSRPSVAGEGARRLAEVIELHDVEWRRLGPDLLLTATVAWRRASGRP
jgi:diaminohydroxyphosphoribosylaminopyrimidine deaminase / 5-amino-6-(5-phosphoribosylamino)uracil reductase